MNNLTDLINQATTEYNQMVNNTQVVSFNNYLSRMLRRKQDKYYQTANEVNMQIGWKGLKDNPHENELEFFPKKTK